MGKDRGRGHELWRFLVFLMPFAYYGNHGFSSGLDRHFTHIHVHTHVLLLMMAAAILSEDRWDGMGWDGWNKKFFVLCALHFLEH